MQASENVRSSSATGTYIYKLAKWLDVKLKPLSVNDHTVSDIFPFADDLREMKIYEQGILASYNVSSLFTNIPVSKNNRNPSGEKLSETIGLTRNMTLTSQKPTL